MTWKKCAAVLLSAIMALSVSLSACVAKSDGVTDSEIISFDTEPALYAHAVLDSTDSEAWQQWQCEHTEKFKEINRTVKYFFLPTSADDSEVDIYNAYSTAVTVNGVSIASGEVGRVPYDTESEYTVEADGTTYTLIFMKSNAEAAIYINNSDADGNGTELMDYLNTSKSNSASATGAVVNPDGTIDNTTIKKIKGRGTTAWGKAKKAYNITYDSAVSVGDMGECKKFSIIANYQDDSLSRNRFLYDLSDAVDMPYASDSRYVDFYVNGFYWGSYQMAQKVDTGSSNLLNDIDEADYLNEDGTINEEFQFVCEVDAGATSDDYYFISSSGNKITIKAPNLSEADVGYDAVKAYVKEKFDAMFTALENGDDNISDYIDVESVTKLYLINELGKNWDAGNSSLFFAYKQDDDGNWKFFGSPVWDYDNSLGNAVGIKSDLSDVGVTDYEEYTGEWCAYNGKNSSNIMNLIACNEVILEAAPEIWFKYFVPAINTFMSENVSEGEIYSSDVYYNLIKDSAEMNYQSGWLLKVSNWIADHSSLYKASFDVETGVYTVSSSETSYDQTFEGMYNYCVDWLTSRAAWMSSQMYDDYYGSTIMASLWTEVLI